MKTAELLCFLAGGSIRDCRAPRQDRPKPCKRAPLLEAPRRRDSVGASPQHPQVHRVQAQVAAWASSSTRMCMWPTALRSRFRSVCRTTRTTREPEKGSLANHRNHQLADPTSPDRVGRAPGAPVQPARVGLVRNPPSLRTSSATGLRVPDQAEPNKDHCSEADSERGLRPRPHLDTRAPARPKRPPPAPTGEGPCRN